MDVKQKIANLNFFFDVLQAFLEEVDRTDNDKNIFFISDFDTFRPLFFSVSTLRRQGIFPWFYRINKRYIKAAVEVDWGWYINQGS